MLKRAEVKAALEAADPPVEFNDSQYSRIIKDLMTNQGGGNWQLKSGDVR